MKYFLIGTVYCLAFILSSCNGNRPQGKEIVVEHPMPVADFEQEVPFKKGDLVPVDEVCMVNDAYMGKKQIAVIHNEKTYYGCCKMCEERIPKDEGVRTAIDPFSKHSIDKADAVIAIGGNNGEVYYFENESNHQYYFNKTKITL